MIRRSASLALSALVLVLSSCASDSDAPDPSFAATDTTVSTASDVKARFLEYIAVGNAVDYSDPATFEPIYAVTTGSQREFEEDLLTSFHDEGWSYAGASTVTKFGDPVYDSDGLGATLQACMDTSTVEYLDASGEQRVPADNEFMNTVDITFARAASDEEWLIADFQVADAGKGICLLD